MRVFIFLHILTMFTAVALAYGSHLLTLVAVRSNDVSTVRAVTRTVGRIGPWIGPVFGVGVILGIVAIFTNGFNPLAPWLVIAYVLTALAIVWANAFTVPHNKALAVAAGESPDDAYSDELRRAIRDNFGLIAVLDVLIIVALIADMVLKPFS